MATRRAFAPRGRARGFRPQGGWSAVASTGLVTVATSTKVLVASFTPLLPVETIRRTRGIVFWKSDQQTATEDPIGAFGMAIVSADAFAAGAASIPGPFSDDGSDLWFVHQYLHTAVTFSDATGLVQLGTQYEIDSKAMRKLSAEEILVLMVENGSATLAAQFQFGIRVYSTLSSR